MFLEVNPLLITKAVVLKWTQNNKKHYISKGYNFTKIWDDFTVDVNDLSENSDKKVLCQCDYCLKIYTTSISKIFNGRKSRVKKDCCSNCRPHKKRESDFITYGVEHTSMLDEVKSKISNGEKKDFDLIKKEFIENGYTLITTQKEYKNNQTDLLYICPFHPDCIQKIAYGNFQRTVIRKRSRVCKFCAIRSGKDCSFWKGGVTKLHKYLRKHLDEWKMESLKLYNYKCAITSATKNLQIHHLYGFNKILEETLKKFNLDIDASIGDLPDSQLEIIKNSFIELHNRYGLGIPLSKDIHHLFHKIYDYGDNTPEQFEEFKLRYRMGEFNEIISV